MIPPGVPVRVRCIKCGHVFLAWLSGPSRLKCPKCGAVFTP